MRSLSFFLANPASVQRPGVNQFPEHNHTQLSDTLLLPARASSYGRIPEQLSQGPIEGRYLERQALNRASPYHITWMFWPFSLYKEAKCYLIIRAVNLLLILYFCQASRKRQGHLSDSCLSLFPSLTLVLSSPILQQERDIF